MAHFSLSNYCQQLETALSEKDGVYAGELLSFRHPHVANPRLQLEHPESQCERWFTQPWDELVAAHLRCCWAVANHDFIDAYGCQSLAVQTFTKIFQSQKDENWSLPIMFTITLDLRLFANSADVQLAQKRRGKPGATLEKAAELLMACFRVCAADRYYVGRKAIFDNDFKNAEEYLLFAFQRSHRQAKKNKRLILIYLLPVKMLLGHMPKQQLLKKYDLLQFSDVTTAVSCGNLLLLNEALQKNEEFFIKCGIYLILEKLKIITYRNLFKKVALILNTHQMPISAFTVALKMMGEDEVDDDEVECILANLIYENKIKGYISHQHRKLVISKQNPFPALSSVL
ncbi:hypothetical protein LSH36_305g03077 [Paralvinella palmiformis]|uniref:CSN12-like protein n=1 Tax=Paralvinella palmiformis TaxID=53620 RepID=A0AAD9JHA5_9ANNE|nr:hypothetical protein LSH36_305g03077 [Paralvinella palmiformis]